MRIYIMNILTALLTRLHSGCLHVPSRLLILMTACLLFTACGNKVNSQNYEKITVHLREFFRQHSLEMVITRAEVFKRLELAKALPPEPKETPPGHCPACHQALLGSWTCHSCGLELDSRERRLRREPRRGRSLLPRALLLPR